MDNKRNLYKYTVLIYLRDDELDGFDDALEEAICPDSDEDGRDHDCRLITMSSIIVDDDE